MPVSTRSQVSADRNDRPPPPSSLGQEASSNPVHATAILRNPHHGLKEKMRALTLFYEQHKQHLASSHDPSKRPDALAPAARRPIVELTESNRKKNEENSQVEDEEEEEEEEAEALDLPMKENIIVLPSPSKAAARTNHHVVFPRGGAAKENPRIAVYSCPKKPPPPPPPTTVARKLSMGGLGTQSEGRVTRTKNATATAATANAAMENGEIGGGSSRIMVYVRLRPMSKKEKDGGSRSCVRIVNKKDVYLTEFASETDYLRLKRVRGRHFSFDASFPDSTTQQEVYATT